MKTAPLRNNTRVIFKKEVLFTMTKNKASKAEVQSTEANKMPGFEGAADTEFSAEEAAQAFQNAKPQNGGGAAQRNS